MPGLYTIVTRADGITLTAAVYNSDHQNHVDNHEPRRMDDLSSTLVAYQADVTPSGAGQEQLPGSLEEEILQLRGAIRRLAGVERWYTPPTATIPELIGIVDSLTAQVSDIVDNPVVPDPLIKRVTTLQTIPVDTETAVSALDFSNIPAGEYRYDGFIIFDAPNNGDIVYSMEKTGSTIYGVSVLGNNFGGIFGEGIGPTGGTDGKSNNLIIPNNSTGGIEHTARVTASINVPVTDSSTLSLNIAGGNGATGNLIVQPGSWAKIERIPG